MPAKRILMHGLPRSIHSGTHFYPIAFDQNILRNIRKYYTEAEFSAMVNRINEAIEEELQDAAHEAHQRAYRGDIRPVWKPTRTKARRHATNHVRRMLNSL
jgi:hypothetical protein